MMSITPERLNILRLLNVNGEMKNSEIAEILGKSKQTISNMLSKLQGLSCVINTRYGFYEISLFGKRIVERNNRLEDIANS